MESIVAWVAFFTVISICVLFFIINIKIVRRLRKNPITKDAMGFHLFWGWYALNISEVLFFSKKWMTKRRNRSHGYMFANYDLVHQYTTRFEKLICKIFVLLGMFFGVGILIMMVLDGLEFLMRLAS